MDAGLIKGVLVVPNVFCFWALANAHDLTLDVIGRFIKNGPLT